MSAADEAYAAFEQAIEEAIAIASGADTLGSQIRSEEFAALEVIPPRIAEAETVRELYLNDTQVADLAPLSGLTGLQGSTSPARRSADLAPLSGLTGLQRLDLNDTPVADLSPCRG